MLTWFCFAFGQFCYWLAQLNAIVRATNNTAESMWHVFKTRWVNFGIRATAGIMLFWLFLGGGLPSILTAFGVESPAWLETMSAIINSQGGPPMAWFAGLGIDGLLGFIPLLKAYIPPADTKVSEFKETKTVPGGIQSTKQTTEVVTTPIAPKGE